MSIGFFLGRAGGNHQLAAGTVGEPSGRHGAYKASRYGDTHGQALERGGVLDAEKHFVEGFGATDYHPVVAKQEAAHGRDTADEIDKFTIEIFHGVK